MALSPSLYALRHGHVDLSLYNCVISSQIMPPGRPAQEPGLFTYLPMNNALKKLEQQNKGAGHNHLARFDYSFDSSPLISPRLTSLQLVFEVIQFLLSSHSFSSHSFPDRSDEPETRSLTSNVILFKGVIKPPPLPPYTDTALNFFYIACILLVAGRSCHFSFPAIDFTPRTSSSH